MLETRHAAWRRLIPGSLLVVGAVASLGVAAKTAPKRATPAATSAAQIARIWKAPPVADPESSAYPSPAAQWPGFPMLPDGRFPIGAYGGPLPAQTADFRYAEFAGAGFTINLKLTEDPGLEESNLQRLRVGHRVNLWSFVYDDRIAAPGRAYAPGWRSAVDSVVGAYAKEPGLLGYLLADQPAYASFPSYVAVNQRLARRDPSHPGLVHLMGYAGAGHSYGGVPYSSYLHRYIDPARPALFAVDSYPLRQSSDSPSFVAGWDSVAHVSHETGVPFWAVLLLTPYGDYRVPTAAELAWQANLPLAYGARGIAWFTYWTPRPTDPQRFHDGAVTYDGRRTATYGRLTDVNAHIQALGQEMARWEWLGARQVGSLPAGTRALTQAEGLRVQSSTPLTVGFFKQMSGQPYALVVNRDYKSVANVKIFAPDTLLRWTRAPGLYRPLDAAPEPGSKLIQNRLTISPGDAELVRLPRSFDYLATQH